MLTLWSVPIVGVVLLAVRLGGGVSCLRSPSERRSPQRNCFSKEKLSFIGATITDPPASL